MEQCGLGLLVDLAGGARPDATSGGWLTNMNFPGTFLITANAPSRLPSLRSERHTFS